MLNIVFVALAAALEVQSITVGPVTDLQVVNANISPDGFTRP
jgi:hypothetical protein